MDNRIAYYCTDGERERTIYVVNADDSNKNVLTTLSSPVSQAGLSHDGSKQACTYSNHTPPGSYILDLTKQWVQN